jgi:aminopeptidase-like protein
MSQRNTIQKIDREMNSGHLMFELAKRLYPICRSITGNGVRETLSIVKEIVPLEMVEVPSGTKVLDWEVPEEWNIGDAWIKNSAGEKIIDFKQLNLHVLNYSTPVDRQVGLKELKEHVFTLPEYPEWVPYRTSYYNRQWGFCMSQKQLESLPEDSYQVKIDSELKPGSLTYGEFVVPGKSEEEVLFSCHICHPSLCNDNLSGIALATYIAEFVKSKALHYTYRFLFIPGTIGSITWLSRNEDLLEKIKYGLVLTLLGDSSPFHYKKSRRGDAEIDRIMNWLLEKEEGARLLDFSPYGYDERQFCSPGFNLPVGRLSRKPHGEFPEYHTSADNLDFIQPEHLNRSYEFLLKVISVIEGNKKWINLSPKGEPQLGKRGLYKQVGGMAQQKDYQMAILWILNYSDGNHSLLDIAKKSGIEFSVLNKAAMDLQHASLLKPAS